MALRMFGGAGREHMQKYGTKLETFAAIRAKASRHAVNNPLAIFRKEVTIDDVMNDMQVWPEVMTRLMACPPTCGGAAAIIVSERFAKKHGLRTDVRILAQADDHRLPEFLRATFDDQDGGLRYGSLGRAAGLRKGRRRTQGHSVAELHDCFAHNELLTYEALGFCPEGGAEKFVNDGDNTYGGQVVTNPSGGLLVQGASAGRNRPGAVLRADAPVARHGRSTPGARRRTCAAAQPRPRRRLRRHAVRPRLTYPS